MDFVEQLKSSVDIVSVVGEYVRLRKSGAHALCGPVPVPQREDPFLLASTPVHQFYKCFGCGAGGDVLNFVMQIEGSASTKRSNSWPSATASPCPSGPEYADRRRALRAAIHQMHEIAEENFRANLRGAAGADGARISGQARRRAGHRRSVRPRLRRRLRPRPAAHSCEQRGFHRRTDGGFRPGGQARRRQLSTTASATG